jgi:hypothetical protein
VRAQLYNFAKRGVPKRMSVIMWQDSVLNSEYAEDYINTTWIQRHNHTFRFINIIQIIDRYQISIISFTSHLKYHKPRIKQILIHITNHTRMKNVNRDNSLLSLCRQDIKKGKELWSIETKSATHHPPSPRHHRPASHCRRSKKHE